MGASYVSLSSCGGGSCWSVMRDPDLCCRDHLSVKGKRILPWVFTVHGTPELREIKI